MVRKVVSGGQTGVDRAALDVALEIGLEVGGWCPRGRCAEDGPIDPRYPLVETPSRVYSVRTRWNVRDSDATLILTEGPATGGTLATVDFAVAEGRPHLVVDLLEAFEVEDMARWIAEVGAAVLNVAGPRESKRPGISGRAADVLRALLKSTRR